MNGEGGTCESTVLFSHTDVTNDLLVEKTIIY